MGTSQQFVLEGVTKLADSVGTADFDASLLQLTRSLLPHDTCLAMRLAADGSPKTIFVDGISQEAMQAYEGGLYREDPIIVNWCKGQLNGVHGLQRIDSEIVCNKTYYKDFLNDRARISDELGFILPRMGQGAVGLWLQRSKGGFKDSDFARVQRFYPFISSLNRCHQGWLVSMLRKLAEEKSGAPVIAIKAVDTRGRVLYVDGGWDQIARELPLVDQLAATMVQNNRSSTMLRDGRLFLRIPIESTGFLGGVGTLFVIRGEAREAKSGDVERGPCWDLLTQREAEIVRLILRGYPNALIAEKLALSLGTIKNYRSRLYYKLDVTTERELILMFKSAGSSPPPALK